MAARTPTSAGISRSSSCSSEGTNLLAWADDLLREKKPTGKPSRLSSHRWDTLPEHPAAFFVSKAGLGSSVLPSHSRRPFHKRRGRLGELVTGGLAKMLVFLGPSRIVGRALTARGHARSPSA